MPGAHYTVTCGPLTIPVCGSHVHAVLSRLENLPAPAIVRHQDAEDCVTCRGTSD